MAENLTGPSPKKILQAPKIKLRVKIWINTDNKMNPFSKEQNIVAILTPQRLRIRPLSENPYYWQGYHFIKMQDEGGCIFLIFL